MLQHGICKRKICIRTADSLTQFLRESSSVGSGNDKFCICTFVETVWWHIESEIIVDINFQLQQEWEVKKNEYLGRNIMEQVDNHEANVDQLNYNLWGEIVNIRSAKDIQKCYSVY